MPHSEIGLGFVCFLLGVGLMAVVCLPLFFRLSRDFDRLSARANQRDAELKQLKADIDRWQRDLEPELARRIGMTDAVH